MRIEKFTNLYRDVTKEGTKIPQEKYCLTGQFPIVDQGQRVIAGWWNDDAGIFKNVPAIIFGDHTRAIKYMEQPFFIGADGVKILRPTNIKDNPKYLYYALQAAKIPNLGYSRHFKVVKELQICIYSRDEQNEIVRVLEKIDYLIEQRHAETTYLDQLVKSRFIELFGDPIKNTQHRPTTAFVNVVTMQRGFDLPVQDRKQSGNIPVYGSNGVLDHHNQAKVCNGGVITGRSGTIGKVFYTTGAYWPLNTTLFSVDTHENNIIYLAHLVRMFNLDRFTEGTGVPTLNRNKFHSAPIIDVPIDEQNQFAAFVEQTDKSKYYSSLSFRYCQAAANTYRQEWMTCRTSDF